MGDFYLFLILFFLCFFLVARPVTTLFHELGHAIPALLFTKKKVTIYLGSHGDPKNSLNFCVGKIEVWFRYNPFLWRGGLCRSAAIGTSFTKKFIYLICGPLASILLGCIVCYFAFAYDLHGAIKLLVIIFLPSALLDLLINIIPSKKPIILYNGNTIHNDGHELKILIKNLVFKRRHAAATKLYDSKEYLKAAVFFERILKRGLEHENVYRSAIAANIASNKLDKALQLYDFFEKKYKLNSADYCQLAMLYGMIDHKEDSLAAFDKSLALDPENIKAFNTRGAFYNIWENYDKAILDFDATISLNSSYAFSFASRGLSKLKLGDIESGLADINKSFDLDPNNSYGYRNLGIYYLDAHREADALKNFIRAKELDSNTYIINDLILLAK